MSKEEMISKLDSIIELAQEAMTEYSWIDDKTGYDTARRIYEAARDIREALKCTEVTMI